MAPLLKEFQKDSYSFETKVCVTAQHREMLDQVLGFFEINPEYDLDLMKPDQDLYSLTATIINSLKSVLDDFKPDFVFVHGDTTTSMASALAAFYCGANICHVEAGLRTNNKFSPYPEEINRQITGRLCDYHFAPTENSKLNLLAENVSENNILVTGNTVIDSLEITIKKLENQESDGVKKLKEIINGREVILVTGHRRENHGGGFIRICNSLKEIAEKKPQTLIVYPVHLNPRVQNPVNEILSNIPNVELIDPLCYPDFIWLMNYSRIILTDSGGVQEEAPSLGKPVLVMRDTTERPEAIDAGTVILVGSDQKLIVNEVLDLLENKIRYKNMSELHNPYGDGKACERIVEYVRDI